jgi:predicted metal-binding membrane protein
MRTTAPSVVVLAGVAGASWVLLFAMGDEMPMGAGLWLGAWTVMMAAMMLPSAAPLVLLYSLRSDTLASTLLMAGYLLTWAFVGLAAYSVDMRLPDPGDGAVAAVLIAAGVYQFTPLKSACLRRCRSPVDFLVTHWRAGRLGALRIGLEHGAYCVGCCWALMAVLVVAGAMGLVWVVAIAAAIAAEKLLPGGPWLGRVGGIALLVAGIVVAL